MSFFVYILKCADGSYYTGHTDDLEARIQLHAAGSPRAYTTFRLPVTVAWSDEFPTRLEALESERRIKGWSRAKKEALMRHDWAEVSRLAKGHSERRSVGSVGGLRDSRGSTSSPRTGSTSSPRTGSKAAAPRDDRS